MVRAVDTSLGGDHVDVLLVARSGKRDVCLFDVVACEYGIERSCIGSP